MSEQRSYYSSTTYTGAAPAPGTVVTPGAGYPAAGVQPAAKKPGLVSRIMHGSGKAKYGGMTKRQAKRTYGSKKTAKAMVAHQARTGHRY